MPAGNIALIHRWFEEVWNQRRPETIYDLLSADAVGLADGDKICGPNEFQAKMYDPFTGAFPDLRVEVEDVLGYVDHVVVRWTSTGTHTGHGMGIQPSGRKVAFRGMTWIQIRNGKLGDAWQISNIPEVIRGLAAPTE